MTAVVYRRRPASMFAGRPKSMIVDKRKTFGVLEELNRRPLEPILDVKKETLFTGPVEKVVTKTTTIITFRSPPSITDPSRNQSSAKSGRPLSTSAITSSANQPDVVSNSIQKTGAQEIQRLEGLCQESTKQLDTVKGELKHATLGFNALSVVAQQLTIEKQTGAEEISRLEALCKETTQELDAVKTQLKQATLGFDALSVMVQYLSHELDAFSCPSVKSDLETTKQKLEKTLTDLDTAQKDHRKHVKSLAQQKEEEIDKIIDQHSKEVLTLKGYHDKHIAEIQKECQAQLEESQKSHEEAQRASKDEHMHAMTDFQQRHDDKLMEITRRFEDIKVTLSHKVETLRLECEDLRAQARHYQEALERDTDHKVQTALRPYKNLPQEIESLKLVIDMRNEEIRQLRQVNFDQAKQLEELPVARDKIIALQQKIENLEAIVDIKGDYEKQLAEKHHMLLRKFDKESKANKRLSMDNEELSYRLQFDPESPEHFRRQVSRSPPGSPSSPTVVHRRHSPNDFDKSPTHKSSMMRRSWHHFGEKKAKRKSGSHLDESLEGAHFQEFTDDGDSVLVFPSQDAMSKSCI